MENGKIGLNEIYAISEIFNKAVEDGVLKKSMLKEITINLDVEPSILYGIDKELYYISHDETYDGFVHNEEVDIDLYHVKFKIRSIKTKENENN